MRVLVVSLGRRGGVTEYGLLMTKALARLCDVAVISSAGAENRERWAELEVPHLELTTFTSVVSMLLSLFAISRFARMRTFAREFSPDVIYYPGGHAWKPMLDLILPRSATTVLTVHDPELHSGEDSLALRAFAAANRLHVDGYVLLNEAQRPAFIEKYGLEPHKVAVIPHGMFDALVNSSVPLSEFADLADLEPLAGRYVLFLGRIQPYKGIGTLLEAYRMTAAESRMPLVIAGSGELSPAEKELLGLLPQEQVHVVSRWLSDEEMGALVDSARFVILPYLSATQSGVIPLASAYGTPAIASNTGGLAEQVVDGETGLLFSAGDAEALSLTMARAYGLDEDDYGKMAASAQEFAQSNWSWNVLADQLAGFFATLSHEK
jgi:glycosyltransferase involved in cell wall biosynthesis